MSLTGDSNGAWQHLQSTVLKEYVSNTLVLMLLVAAFSLMFAIPTAWLTAATRFPGRGFFTWALLLPLAAPPYIVAYVYTDLLDTSGPVQSSLRAVFDIDVGAFWFPEIRSIPGAALVISLVLYPYVYLLARTAFMQRSTTLFGAARSLGAGPYRAFFRIALPAAKPAIVGGLALVLMETLADFGVVEYFGIPTFSTGIYRTWFSMGEHIAALKLAAMMFVIVCVLLFLERQGRQTAQHAHSRDARPDTLNLTGAPAMFAIVCCALPILLGFCVPTFKLILLASEGGDPLFGDVFVELIQNTLTVAGCATAITLILAAYFTFLQRFQPSKLSRLMVHVATLGYALPGVILAVGILATLSPLDHLATGFAREHFGWNSGLILTGTVTAIVYAYVVRFMTLAYNSTQSGMQAIPTLLDHVARSLGASSRQVAWRIHLPLIQRSLFVGAILVFVDTLRELPATLMLRPFNFETLATRVYRLAGDERLMEASTAALFIIVIGLVPVLVLNRFSMKTHH